MSRRLVLATRNQHKVAELRRILAAAGVGVELSGSEAFADLPDIPETGESFAENALIKARAVAGHTGIAAVADDSGICVDALNGMPGVLSARWSGTGDDDAGVDLVLAQVRDVPDARRGARFVCAAALVLPDGSEHVVEGTLEGALAHGRRGSNGFGYDPIFVPTGSDRTTAELDPAEKDAISHRGRAFRALAPVIDDYV